jgi:hypothetical protein
VKIVKIACSRAPHIPGRLFTPGGTPVFGLTADECWGTNLGISLSVANFSFWTGIYECSTSKCSEYQLGQKLTCFVKFYDGKVYWASLYGIHIIPIVFNITGIAVFGCCEIIPIISLILCIPPLVRSLMKMIKTRVNFESLK